MAAEYDPTDLRAQAAASEAKQRRERIRQETDDADLKWLMGTRRGRRILWRMLDRAGVFRLSFNTNAMAMAFAEGQRNEGLRILARIHALCPERYPTMVSENADDKRNHDDDRDRNDP